MSMTELENEYGYMTANTLSRRLVTVSGVPPLTVRHALPKSPKSITIFGNTVNGSGVGDRTANLFDFTGFLSYLSRKSEPVRRGIYTATNDSITITATSNDAFTKTYESDGFKIPVYPNIRYKLTWKISGESGNIGIFPYGSTTAIAYPSNTTQSAVFTVPSNTYSITLRLGVASAGSSATYSQLQLNTEAEYEPFGYKLPISFTSSPGGLSKYNNIYIDSPIYSNDIYNIPADKLSSLYPGDNTISVNTTVPPSRVDVKYLQ